MKILVIDDMPTERTLFRAWCTKLGHDATCAEDGAMGLAAFEADRPDLVLLDVAMPVMDGFETARQIRRLGGRWVPIIFVSGRSDPEDIAAAIQAGGDDFISKPVNHIVLAAKLLAMQRIAAMRTVMSDNRFLHLSMELQQLAEVENMTGLANSYGLTRGLAREYARCARTGQPISAIMIGTDGRTDEITLRKVATTLQSHITRSPDLVAYWGGDEFCALLPDTPLSGALHLAEHILRTVEQLHGPEARDEPALSIAMGVAAHVPKSSDDGSILRLAAADALSLARTDEGKRIRFGLVELPVRLTRREIECLQWAALGKTSAEIAVILGKSEATINFHMSNVRSKFNVTSRRRAIAKAIGLGLIRTG